MRWQTQRIHTDFVATPRKFVMLSELSIWELLPVIYKSHFPISPRTVS